MIAMGENQTCGCRRYVPTPKDIRGACEVIQATWSPRERARRYRGPGAARWTPPMIRLRELVEAIDEERAGGPAYSARLGTRRISKRAPWAEDPGKPGARGFASLSLPRPASG